MVSHNNYKNMISNRVWFYDNISNWKTNYFKNIVFISDLDEDEIAIKNQDTNEYEFFFTFKKDKETYLLPSQHLKDLPLRVELSFKMPFRGKAFNRVKEYTPIGLKAIKTMEYRELIDSWLNIHHLEPKLFTLHKIICDTFLVNRINVRLLSYPSWGKDSAITILKEIKGKCAVVNKPSLAKLKYLLSIANKGIAINEVQSTKADEIDEWARFYEDVGDYKNEYENPKRKTGGAAERSNISQMSTMTFYNFPNKEDKSDLFDNIFHPKVLSRVMPFLLKGGNETTSAIQEKFEYQNKELTKEEFNFITEWARNHTYYEINFSKGQNRYERKHSSKNIRWQRTWEAIMGRLDMYCKNQEEFDEYQDLLWAAHKAYLKYINGENWEEAYIVEEII